MVEIIQSPNVQRSAHKLRRGSAETPVTHSSTNSKAGELGVSAESEAQQVIDYEAELKISNRKLEDSESKLKDVLEKLNHAQEQIELLNSETDNARLKSIKQGHDEGYQEGIERAQMECDEKLTSIITLFENIEKKQIEFVQKAEDSLIEIVYASVLKMVGDVSATKEGIESIIKHNAQQIMHRGGVLVHLSPSDFDMVSKYSKPDSKTDNSQFYEMIPDERIEIGGCIIETETGNLDARLDHQLVTFKNTLLEIRNRKENNVKDKN